MAKKRKKPLARGPKGGKKHTPGRDHDKKSRGRKTKKFGKLARERRDAARREAERQWKVWDDLNVEHKKFRPDLFPTYPRPSDGEET